MNPNRPHFAPWDEREWPRLLTAEEGARRARIFARVERRQAELLDEAASTAAEPHVQTMLQRHARHARWHADVWEQHLSDSASVNGEAGGSDGDVDSFLDALAASSGADQAIEALTGIYRVLVPRKITAYTYYQRAIGTQDSDADWRWIDFIVKDELDAIRDGELTLQSLMAGDDEVQRSADCKAALETLMVKAGGLVGPDTLGMAAHAH